MQISHDFSIECRQGDITEQPDIAVVVNAANAQLRSGGGVAGAIHRKAGPELDQECRQWAPINPGEAVITNAYGLPNQYVIHCLGPVYGVDEPADTLLASCYREALLLADEYDLNSIAFPALSTGAFGYPMIEAADIAFKTVIGESGNLSIVKLVRFVLFSGKDCDLHEKVWANIKVKKIDDFA